MKREEEKEKGKKREDEKEREKGRESGEKDRHHPEPKPTGSKEKVVQKTKEFRYLTHDEKNRKPETFPDSRPSNKEPERGDRRKYDDRKPEPDRDRKLKEDDRKPEKKVDPEDGELVERHSGKRQEAPFKLNGEDLF